MEYRNLLAVCLRSQSQHLAKGAFRPIRSILAERKSSWSHESERALGLKLLQFGESVIQAAEDYKPNVLTNYLFELANAYNASSAIAGPQGPNTRAPGKSAYPLRTHREPFAGDWNSLESMSSSRCRISWRRYRPARCRCKISIAST